MSDLERRPPSWLRAYSKWTARIAFVVFVAAVLFLIALLPIGVGRRGSTIWPLSEHFGRHHLIADIELVIGWIAAGLAALAVVAGVALYLADRAEWLK